MSKQFDRAQRDIIEGIFLLKNGIKELSRYLDEHPNEPALLMEEEVMLNLADLISAKDMSALIDFLDDTWRSLQEQEKRAQQKKENI